MTVQRQQSLFAAEDWRVAYKAFSQVNYQAYDFDTMRSAMVDYVRTNFPENYNDYIESSEFIAIIELLAYLAQSLAFRMDVNTRENFLETAERKESVFRLARMLGYNPKRNVTSSGVMKIESVKTTETLTDSLGNDLNNRTIYWDDANNSQSYEQFITVMNAAMSKANRFTAPIKTGTVGKIKTEMYQLNSPIGAPLAYNFSLNINGTNRGFNVVNPDFRDNGFFYERHPDPSNLFNMIYMNDGKGISSQNTGFFLMFRQGNLEFADYNYTTPVENRTETVNVANINETDVYLQEIDSRGLVRNTWTKIPNTVGQTLNYNSQSLNTRRLYSIETINDTGIRLRFADGNFADIPVGIFRLWYRTSDPVRYTIQPEDARGITISLPYVNAEGREHTLTVRMSLQYTVNNSQPAESLQAIKDRAPAVYYTQNRMVSAQDYNVFPQSQSTNITKLKAINRTHAGHSRYIDINDPTGTYRNVDTFADDAFLYVENTTVSENVIINSNTTPFEVATAMMPNRLKKQSVNNLVYQGMREQISNPLYGGNINAFLYQPEDAIFWKALPVASQSKTGYLTEKFSTGQENVLVNSHPYTRQLKSNTFCKFVNPLNYEEYTWVRIVEVENSGRLSSGLSTSIGPWRMSDDVPAGWQLLEVIVTLRKVFTDLEALDIEDMIKQRKTFGLGYDLKLDTWFIIPSTSVDRTNSFRVNSDGRGPRSWLILMEYQASSVQRASVSDSYTYKMSIRGQDFVVQSKDDLRFYNIDNAKTLEANNPSERDSIIFTTVNTKPGDYETYEWNGQAWLNKALGLAYVPYGILARLPLKTRSTTWRDIETSWISNFGILRPINSAVADTVENNRYVNDTEVELRPYFQVGAITSTTDVIVGTGTGTIMALPDTINVPFDADTFNHEIVTTIGGVSSIIYRGIAIDEANGTPEIYVAPLGGTTYSYGVAGDTLDVDKIGNIQFTEYDPVTKRGVFKYVNLQNNELHHTPDSTGVVSSDKLQVFYKVNRDKMDRPIYWDVIDVVREEDGYTDPRKVKVAPFDSDNDLVPDRPVQFNEYVGFHDLVLFEYYTDYDGFVYDRPVEAFISDFRRERSLVVSDLGNYFTPASNPKNKISLTEVDWIIVKNSEVAAQFNGVRNAIGTVIHAFEDDITYLVTTTSTDLGNEVIVAPTQDYFVRKGRGLTQNTQLEEKVNGTIRWKHIAPTDIRIDPSISNVVEMVVLTSSYNNQVRKWQVNPNTDFPLSPTSNELAQEFESLNMYKSASDSLVYRSAQFKLLFGTQAQPEHQAKFRVVRLSDQYSDNELKTRVLAAINDYFDVNNWDFGETFYFTELSSYIHQQLGSAIGSIVILPKNATGRFGEMFQVKSEPNELFISTATVSDIEIISRLDNQTLRTDR